jgi:hypothetical protein
LPDATGDTVAVGTAFGLQPDQLGQIVDAVANAKRSLGGDPGQISQGLASIAAERPGGWLQPQRGRGGHLPGAGPHRRDRSGRCATRLTRIFQTTSGSTGKKLGQELGVDTNQSVRKQLEDYSKIFNAPGTTKAVKDRITSSLGGTANLRELLPVLQDGARLTQSYAEAQSNAGQGQDEFERKSNNLVGTLKKIRGDIKLIEVDLVRSDIFAPFGVMVMTLEPVLHLIDRALKLFDRMPEPIRHITAALIDLAIAAKAVAVVQNVMATRQFTRRAEAGLIQGASALTGGTIRRGGVAVAAPAALERSAAGAATEARNAEALRIAEAMQARMAAEGALTEGVAGAAAGRREAEAAQVPLIFQSAEARAAAVRAEVAGILDAVPARLAAEAELDATVVASAEGRAASEVESAAAARAGAMGGLATLGRTLVNPWTLAIAALVGGAVILNKLFDSIDQKNKFNAQFADSSFALARNDGSAASTRQAAQDLRSAAGNIKRSNATWDAKGVRDDLAKQLNQQAKDLDAIGKRVAREEAANAAKQSTSVFGQGGVVTTVDELAAGLQTLQENGAGAYGSMVALNKELANTATPSNPAFQPEQFASRLSTSALSSVRGMLPDQVEVPDHSVQWATNPQTGQTYQTHFAQTKNITGNEAYARIAKDNPQSRIDKAVRDATDSLGIKPGDVLTPAQETQIARKVANAFDLSSVPKQAKKLREQLFQHLYRQAAGIPETNDNNLFSVGINGVVNSVVDALGLQAPSAATLNGTGPMSAKRALSIVQPGTPNADGSQYPGLVEANQAGLANISADDDGTKKRQTLLAQYRGWKLIVSRIRKAGDKVPYEIAKDTRDAQDAYAEAKIGQLEDLRKVEQSADAGDPRAQKAVGQKFLQKEIDAAGTNGKRLRGIMQNANDQMLALVRATLVQAEEMAKQAADDAQVGRTPANPTIDAGQPTPKQNEAQQTYKDARARRRAFDKAHNNTDSPDKGGNYATAGDTTDADKLTPGQLAARKTRSRVDPTDAVGAASADLAQSRADLRRARADFDTGKITQQDLYSAQQDVKEKRQAFFQAQVDVASAAGGARAARSGDAIVSARVQMQSAAAQMRINARGTAGWWAGLQQWYEGQWAMRQAVAAKRGAIAQAGAARTGGGLAEGRAAIIGAAAQLHAVARGTAEWWQALGSYYQSQDQMRQAVLAYKNVQDQLHGDITDPVENARDAVRNAARKLRMDSRRHAGKDVIAQDRLDARQAGVSEESAKFQQRLSDMQTADDLGRISHQKYLQYLDHEHDRLTRIHKRTRQQQDELDTVDKAMKDAKTAMDSQFNLGDINTKGLVYQIRRFKAENAAQGAPSAAVSNTTHQTVSISINGADTAKVKTIIDGYLRIQGGQRQALTRRKV